MWYECTSFHLYVRRLSLGRVTANRPCSHTLSRAAKRKMAAGKAHTEVPAHKPGFGKRKGLMITVVVVLGLGLGLGLGFGLGLASNAGNALRIPQMKPPVVAATPSGLKATGRRMSICEPGSGNGNCQTVSQVIASRMFSSGPTDFTSRLGKVDEQMQALIRRNAEGGGRKCVGEATTAWSPSSLPGGASFPMVRDGVSNGIICDVPALRLP
jgi:hypothetical protein